MMPKAKNDVLMVSLTTGFKLVLPIPKLVIFFEVERVRKLRISIFVNNYKNRRTVRKLKSTIALSSHFAFHQFGNRQYAEHDAIPFHIMMSRITSNRHFGNSEIDDNNPPLYR
jgi:hypothetical protein